MRPRHFAQPEVIAAQGMYTHTASGMLFPANVGAFQRSKILRYDTKDLDMSAGYDLASMAGSVAATVYVYPAPSLVSIGSPPDVVAAARENLSKNEFEARKREILNFRPGAILVKEMDVSLQQGNTLYSGKMATFEYMEVFGGLRQPLRSHLYLFCYAGSKWVIKYRFTHPTDYDASKDIDDFMKNWHWTLTSS
jgi:hypothetical protein